MDFLSDINANIVRTNYIVGSNVDTSEFISTEIGNNAISLNHGDGIYVSNNIDSDSPTWNKILTRKDLEPFNKTTEIHEFNTTYEYYKKYNYFYNIKTFYSYKSNIINYNTYVGVLHYYPVEVLNYVYIRYYTTKKVTEVVNTITTNNISNNYYYKYGVDLDIKYRNISEYRELDPTNIEDLPTQKFYYAFNLNVDVVSPDIKNLNKFTYFKTLRLVSTDDNNIVVDKANSTLLDGISFENSTSELITDYSFYIISYGYSKSVEEKFNLLLEPEIDVDPSSQTIYDLSMDIIKNSDKKIAQSQFSNDLGKCVGFNINRIEKQVSETVIVDTEIRLEWPVVQVYDTIVSEYTYIDPYTGESKTVYEEKEVPATEILYNEEGNPIYYPGTDIKQTEFKTEYSSNGYYVYFKDTEIIDSVTTDINEEELISVNYTKNIDTVITSEFKELEAEYSEWTEVVTEIKRP